MPTPAEILAQALEELQQATRISGNRNSYRKDTPAEYTKVIAYLQGGAKPTGVTTHIGVGLAGVEDARRELVVVDPPDPPDPPDPAPPTTITPPANLAVVQANSPAGSTITLAAGNFGNQSFSLNKPIRFVGQPGATLGDVSFQPGAGGVEIASVKAGTFTFGSSGSSAKVSDVVLRDIDGTRFWIEHAQRISIIGGDWGPVPSGTWGPRIATSSTDPNRIPVDILIEGGWFHDMVNNAGAEHLEGILLYAGNGITIRNCRFNRLGQTGDLGIFFLHLAGTTPVVCNVLVEGNQGSPANEGYPPYAYFNCQVDKELLARQNAIIRNNTFPRPGTGQWAGPNGSYLTSWPGGNSTVLAPPPGWPR